MSGVTVILGRNRAVRRGIVIAVNIAALTALFAGAIGWMVLMSPLPRQSGRVELSGLNEPVTISRDGRGVPHLRAASSRDAWVALGWTHAQDRMWQMEMMRRTGAGRLAEAVGPAALDSDRFMRTLGLYRRAETALPRLDETTRAALEAYAEGVNAWMTAADTQMPLEYRLLGLRPEPWRPADSLVWQKLMALQLAGPWPDKVLRARLMRRLDSRRALELFPSAPAIPAQTGGLTDDGAQALLARIPVAAWPAPASNLWIVAGSRAAGGKPILANDPHLPLTMPGPWYLATIETPERTVAAATVPGVPFPVIGRTDRIAWGITSTEADTVDLFIEKLDGDGAYRTPEGSRPLTIRDEVIRVHGAADVTVTVRETRHGPVISDLVAGDVAGPGEVVAFASTALGDGDTTLQSLFRLHQAQDWPSFVAALREVQAPALNVGYADTTGTIGLVTAGRIPIRRAGNGLVPVRGWTASGDWIGWIPAAKLPQSLNPRAGMLINANNRPTGDKYPYQIAAIWPDSPRAQRLHDLLESRRGLTADDMTTIQGDTVSLRAIELKDLLGAVEPSSPAARDALTRLAEWSGEMAPDRPEPLILAAWIEHLSLALFSDELGQRFEPLSPSVGQTLIEVLTRRRHWCDNIATPAAESCEEVAAGSLERALSLLSATWGNDPARWKWGEAHRARFEPPVLGNVPQLRRWVTVEIGTGGDDATIARGTYRADGALFPHVHGASLRAVFDLADSPAASRMAIATGQSGHPQSAHYADQIPQWRDTILPRLGTDGDMTLTLVPPLQ